MGNMCGATATREELAAIDRLKKINKDINKKLQKFKEEEKPILKVLLLGTGESGKSTIFKQMQIMYENGFTPIERTNFKQVLRSNSVEAMQSLIQAVYDLEGIAELTQDGNNAAEAVEDLDFLTADFWAESVADLLLTLWNEKSIQEVYERRGELILLDSAGYLFEHMERIGRQGYEPTDEDILRARLRTSGIVEKIFNVPPNNQKINFLDVGGQRNERKKWMHCFDQVASVLFVCAISEFDQFSLKEQPDNLLHPDNKNKLIESHQVFEQIVGTESLSETDIILFLNKIDVFDAKFSKLMEDDPYYPTKVCTLFEDWAPAKSDASNKDDAECRANMTQSAKEHLEKKFSAVCEVAHQRSCYCHFTQATDIDLFQRVFDNIKMIILQSNLKKLGLE